MKRICLSLNQRYRRLL